MDSLPQVLVICTNAWIDNTGINTLSDMFRAWAPDRIAQVYTRSTMPSTTVCNRFFQISETKVMRSILKRKVKTGVEVKSRVSVAKSDDEMKEEKRYKESNHSSWLKIGREFVWLLGRWKTKELDAFVQDVNPDILFLPIYPTVYMGMLQLYVLRKLKKPAVCYLADDNYSYRAIKGDPLMFIHRFFLRRVVKRVTKQCKSMFVIAPRQKEEYDRIFGVDSKIMTKGIDYSGLTYETIIPHRPIRMVYTGKLIIGRWLSLALIAEALGAINQNENLMTLDIYTTDRVMERQKIALNRNGCIVKGAISLTEAKQVQKEADIVVFVESLSKKYEDAARLSFSTKLTDYLQSGKCIFAVGGETIAPIDYLRREDAGIVATSESKILSSLKQIVSDPKMIDEYGRKAFECGKRNHEKSMINERFVREMLAVQE